jgi:DNA-directed RNA polymerase alpha subunit
MRDEHPILVTPIEKIAASVEFVEMCNRNGFKTLSDILEYEAHEMLTKPDFTVRLLIEFYSILKSYKLERRIKER